MGMLVVYICCNITDRTSALSTPHHPVLYLGFVTHNIKLTTYITFLPCPTTTFIAPFSSIITGKFLDDPYSTPPSSWLGVLPYPKWRLDLVDWGLRAGSSDIGMAIEGVIHS
jgi:hypothetical protein